MSGKHFKYLEGLNSLRFFAAFLVIIYHATGSLIQIGLITNKPIPICDKGDDAVDFFFTLSGFLITYLLLGENQRSNTISIRKFYIRRMLRIWPVYFLIVFFRFFLSGILYPILLHTSEPDFPIVKGLSLYIFFLPNLAAALYNVGLLHPLWSIGVEEQFYLFWAPLFKWSRKNVNRLIAVAVPVCVGWYFLVANNTFGFGPITQEFLLSQRFFAMIIGAGFAFILFYRFDSYDQSFLASRFFQFIILGTLIYHYFLTDRLESQLWFRMFAPVLYGAFILNVSVVTRKIISLERKPFIFLGEISYGLYMYHMVIDFFLKKGFQKLLPYHINHNILIFFYFILILGGAILLSFLSYRYFEARFLKLKDRFATIETPKQYEYPATV
jgi:peptidoglycan/LPS O-acetylase OafA/YrhL